MLFFAINHFPTQNLLSDAKMGEDVVKGLGGGNESTSDISKLKENEFKVFGNNVSREACFKRLADTGEMLVRAL